MCTLKSAHARMHRKEKDIVPRTNRRARSSKSSGKKRREASRREFGGCSDKYRDTLHTRATTRRVHAERKRERETGEVKERQPVKMKTLRRRTVRVVV